MREIFLQGIGPVFSFFTDYRFRMVRFEMALTFLVMATCVFTQAIDTTLPPVAVAAATTGKVKVATTTAPETPVQVTVPASEPTPIVSPTITPVTPPPACSPSSTYTSTPAVIALGSYGEGLTTLRSTSYYRVYGSNRSEVITQMLQCGASREYGGEASYAISWSYALRAGDDGLCRVVAGKVGVRTSVLRPDGEVGGGITHSWQSMIAGLSAHETGHVALAEQYGARMLASLQNYPAGDCYTMGSGVEMTANSVANQLKSAQSSYDLATSHGASQGALF